MDEASLRRGLILQALQAQEPLQLRRRALDRQVAPFYSGDSGALVADIDRLEDQRYLARTRKADGTKTYEVLWITPRGLSLMDGGIQDSSIQFGGAS